MTMDLAHGQSAHIYADSLFVTYMTSVIMGLRRAALPEIQRQQAEAIEESKAAAKEQGAAALEAVKKKGVRGFIKAAWEGEETEVSE